MNLARNIHTKTWKRGRFWKYHIMVVRHCGSELRHWDSVRVRGALGSRQTVKCSRVAYCMLAFKVYGNSHSIFDVTMPMFVIALMGCSEMTSSNCVTKRICLIPLNVPLYKKALFTNCRLCRGSWSPHSPHKWMKWVSPTTFGLSAIVHCSQHTFYALEHQISGGELKDDLLNNDQIILVPNWCTKAKNS